MGPSRSGSLFRCSLPFLAAVAVPPARSRARTNSTSCGARPQKNCCRWARQTQPSTFSHRSEFTHLAEQLRHSHTYAIRRALCGSWSLFTTWLRVYAQHGVLDERRLIYLFQATRGAEEEVKLAVLVIESIAVALPVHVGLGQNGHLKFGSRTYG